jgi:hypothetical protein
MGLGTGGIGWCCAVIGVSSGTAQKGSVAIRAWKSGEGPVRRICTRFPLAVTPAR